MKRVFFGIITGLAVLLTACQSERTSLIKPDSLELAVVGEANAVQENSSEVVAQTGCVSGFFIDVAAYGSQAGLPDPEMSVSCSGGSVNVTTNEIPTHEVGEFPNQRNPNTISVQNRNYSFAQSPTVASETTSARGIRFGISLGGVTFDPFTAEFYNNDRNSGWNYSALEMGLGVDMNNAHVQPTGSYHYHGVPSTLIDQLGSVNGLTLVGFAADGFPIYYSTNPGEAVSSYQVQSGTRPDGPGGTYDGTFEEDWEYVAGVGTLDQCNGMYGSTTEFPDGTYLYFLTDMYPYVPRCFVGTPDASFVNGPGGQQGAPAGGAGGQQQVGPAGGQQGLQGGPSGGQQRGQQGGPAVGQQQGPGQGAGRPDIASAAAQLGVTEDQLRAALGDPSQGPPDFQSAAEALGVSMQELQQALRPQ